MQAHVKLGRIFGVEIGFHYSWLIIALLIVLSLVAQFTATNPQWSTGTVWVLAIITALLFFASIVVHEMSHALMAKARGLPIRSIVLFALGGMAKIEKEAADPTTEFWIGIVGPITSAVIGYACLWLAAALGWSAEILETPSTPFMAALVWLGYINILLALFNMIPGFPLDGGRVLRAIIWWITGNADRATRIASRIGQIVAIGFIVIGILRFFGGAGIGGLWLAFIGWFLLEAARASYQQVEIAAGLRGVRVADVMANDCPVVDAHINLQSFADEHLLRTGRRCFIVERDGKLAGLITPGDIKTIDRSLWSTTAIGEIMRPLDKLQTITADSSASEALEQMGRNDLNQLPVVGNGRIEGVISRGNILQFLQTRAELNM